MYALPPLGRETIITPVFIDGGHKGDALVFSAECTGKAVDSILLLRWQKWQIGTEIPAGLLRLFVGHGIALSVVPAHRIQGRQRTLVSAQ